MAVLPMVPRGTHILLVDIVLSNKFAEYFTNKVSNIRDELDNECSLQNRDSDFPSDSVNESLRRSMASSPDDISVCTINATENSKCSHTMQGFSPVDEDEVKKIISKLPNKTSPLDPIPTWLMRKFINTLLPIIMSIINNSLRIGSFPSALREAVITPLIKKPTLNPDFLKNYRPVSNLPTLGKILEYPAVSRFKQHFEINGLSETFQSAYKSRHSTETALLKVKNDMCSELDKGKLIMLVLLDLSSAFDTIDHDILVERMKKEFGITSCAKNWLESYLKDRSSRVSVLGEYSEKLPLKYGVPQGSVAGPPIFTAYAQPVAAIINSFQVA